MMPIPAGADTWNILSPGSPYPLSEDFTYKLGDNGIILNPNSSDFPFVDIDKITGLDNAPYRTTERDHEGTDGGFMDAEYEKGRSIVLDGTLFGEHDQIEPFLDAIKANWAPSRTLVPFYFKKPGVDERFVKVKPLGCRYDVEQMRRIGQTSIQFSMFAEDPRLYTSTLKSASIAVDAVIQTGRAYNRSYNYSYGDVVEQSGGNIVVGGNRPTPTLITIYGKATNPIIMNDSLGKQLQFNITLAEGETLVIDTYYHTVKLNGTANRRSTLLDPEWFSLLPGNNFLRYRAANAGGSRAVFQYYDAWR